jgi:hypothetical protein
VLRTTGVHGNLAVDGKLNSKSSLFLASLFAHIARETRLTALRATVGRQRCPAA